MQTKKNTTIEPDVTIPLPEGVTWSEFITRISEEKNQRFLKKISPATFRFILEESNRPKIIKSLLKTLKQTDPKNATKEYAEKMLSAMQEFARTNLKSKDKKSITTTQKSSLS
jgi:hypothetical protein